MRMLEMPVVEGVKQIKLVGIFQAHLSAINILVELAKAGRGLRPRWLNARLLGKPRPLEATCAITLLSILALLVSG